jgi:hypothetical protein
VAPLRHGANPRGQLRKSHEEIAEAVSTPGRPLIAYMVKLYLHRVGERRGFVTRLKFEEHLRKSPGDWKGA